MPKPMPKSALPREHRKHPSGLYSLYEARRLLYNTIQSTKAHISRLRWSDQAFQQWLEIRLDWLAQDDGDIETKQSGFSQAIQDVPGVPILSFVLYRHLQQTLNRIRKLSQNNDIEDIPCHLKSHFLTEVISLYNVIRSRLMNAFRRQSLPGPDFDGSGSFVNVPNKSNFWAEVKKMDRTRLTQTDKTLALLTDLVVAKDFWAAYDSLRTFFAHMDDHPGEMIRFDPATYLTLVEQAAVYVALMSSAITVCNGDLCPCQGIEAKPCTLFEILAPIFSKKPWSMNIQKSIVQDIITSTYLPKYNRDRDLADMRLFWNAVVDHLKSEGAEITDKTVVIRELVELLEEPRARTEKKVSKSVPPLHKGRNTLSSEARSDGEGKTPSVPLDDAPRGTPEHQLIRTPTIFRFRDQDSSSLVYNRLKTIEKYRVRGYGQMCLESPASERKEDVTKRVWEIEDPADYHEVWRVIFPCCRSDRQMSRVWWPSFQRAMQAPPVNCRIKRAADPVYVFERHNQNGGREIFECHAPHGNGWIPASDLYRYKRDLRNTFGMDAKRIRLASK